tara:strand:+ start:372 stop:1112 length:741 start_codon:yes stop_codon:yes gene_type:complete
VLGALALWGGEIMSTEGSQSVEERTEKTRKEYGPLVTAIKAVGRAMFSMGDALLSEFPRTKVRWTSRDGAESTESEVLARLGAQAGMDRTTLVAARNTSAAFPKSVRLASVPFSVYKALQAEAWADSGARRTQIVEWIAEARSAKTLTAETAAEHATALRIMRKGVTETGTGKAKAVKVAPNGHDQHAEATDAEGKVAGLTAFVVAFREDPEAFAEFLPIIGRDWDIMGETLGAVPTDAELIVVTD